MSIPATTLGLRLLRRPITSSLPCSGYTTITTAFKPIRPSTLLRLTRTYASKPVKRSGSKPSGSLSQSISSNSPRYWSLEENLAKAGHETVLYQSGSRLLIYIYYSLSVVSIGWAGLEFYDNVICQPEAPQWTKSVSALGAGMGLFICAYCFWVPSRMVHRIVAIPKIGSVPPSVSLQIQARSIIPFRKRIINSTPKATTMVDIFHSPISNINRWEIKGYFGPMKYIAWLAYAGFRKLVKALRMEDFAKLKIGDSGLIYRIDRQGWAWERERKGLDVLLKGETKYYPYQQSRS
ncbi:hypothetical protein AOL_s00083g152 [Orbilia oligospora ATCC 24927]|uniref:Uncharacterized protein n=2 Tax=Orbilia oligospora TaxID=2813651 RepID=G1XGM1_ARTOA|nr:hypothetical protein AOL_s00083g152 [Orbilia oligospora ATCC 24927]EGX47644.1 hypothetical protein AOL_s00083g152 [Orbilia oligospora ATCC 24927]KAF3285540.1 hypothetical protein TWF970_010584 [Orbilia oligospora]